MRNETVERIVNLLFQDVEMTDEVQALYDETMSNCQERYQDMTSRGLSDDDAIAAVVESLKGMEDVISQYPKKSESPEAEEAPKSADVPVDDDGDGEQTDFTFGGYWAHRNDDGVRRRAFGGIAGRRRTCPL